MRVTLKFAKLLGTRKLKEIIISSRCGDDELEMHIDCAYHLIVYLVVGVGERGAYELVHGDLLRQHSFGTTWRFTGPVPADSRQ